MKRTAIFGPPGTGKTTKLMEIIEQEISSGLVPNDIAFVSFTNAAVNEAKLRVSEKFGFKKKDVMWFRTVHSLCHSLGHRPGMRIIKPLDLYNFASLYRVAEFSKDKRRREKGDVALHAYNLARSADIPLKDAWTRLTNWVTFDFDMIEDFVMSYEEWKKDSNMIDFQDMIDHYLERPLELDIQVSIIDEAQDLNGQQWEVVEKTFCKSERQYIAGDDDQSIYAWSGCRVDKMLDYPANKKIILEQSYRCPKKVHAVADIIINRVKTRQPKDWKPVNKMGTFKMYGDYAYLPFDKYPDDSWFILARADYMLEEIRWWLKQIGEVYIDEQGNSVKMPIAQRIMSIVKLQRGESINANVFRKSMWESDLDYNVIDFVHLPSNGQISMKDAKIDLTGLDPVGLFSTKIGNDETEDYYRRALAVKKDLLKKPVIELFTIHKVKGREADNVVLMLDQTSSIADSAMADPDNEHRNWYVAVTRAKKRLFPLMAQSKQAYTL